MAGLQIEYLKKLDPARRENILSRSQVDVIEVLATVAPILAALRREAMQNPCGSTGNSKPTWPRPTWRPLPRRSRRPTGPWTPRYWRP